MRPDDDAGGDDAQVISMAQQRAARSSWTATPAAGPDPARCGAITRTGRPCRNLAADSGRCHLHRAGPADAAGAGPADATSAGPGRPPAGFGVPRHEPVDREWERATEQLRDRGFGPPVDVLHVLREAEAQWPQLLEEVVTFVRRRLRGDYVLDEFGFDEDLTTNVVLPLVRPLHRYYWRVESRGTEHLPREGGALVVANHAGTFPADALITRLDVYDHTRRHTRELGADLLFRTPLMAEIARRTGVTLASVEEANRLLAAGELVTVWPEGFKGLGKRWADRYQLRRFGRGGFVSTALRAGAPIVPTAIVGSEEIYPLLFDLRPVARLLDLPYFPIVAQMFAWPLIGPFALLPFPSKWMIEYGEPIDTTGYPADAADDPMTVFDLTDEVRGTIQRMLDANVTARRSVLR